MMKENENIKQKPIKSNGFSSGGMICGSVKIDDSSRNNNTSIKQYTSMINEEMNDLLKAIKVKCWCDRTRFKKHYNRKFKNSSWQTKEVKQNMNRRTDNDEIINMLKLIQTNIDLNSTQLSELKDTWIWIVNYMFKT